MEGMEAAATPARGGPPGSRTARLTQVTSTVERNGPGLQPDNGHLLRPRLYPGEDQTPSLMPSPPPRAWRLQLQGPSVLESKVRALKEKMTAHKQQAKPCPTSHEHASSKVSRCQRVKARGVQALSESSPLPGAMVAASAQNLSDGQLDSSINEEPAKNVDSRPPRSPAPGLQSWNEQSLWPPEAVRTLPDHEKSPPPGPGSLQESPIHQPTAGQPQGPSLCKTIHMPSLKKGRSYPLQDGLATGGGLDNTVLTSTEDSVPRTALLGALWRAGDLGALGTGDNVLSLSDQVERNRLLLQEMLRISGQSPLKVGSPSWTPSRDRAPPERPAGDVDWDLDIPLQDSGQSRTFGPKLEPMLNARHEEAKHLLQHARMKARTQPLRASHDIVPTIAQGSRDGQRSPALGARMTSACRDSLQNGNLSDSSSGESSSGQWFKQGIPLSHVRFEDESACEAQVRYLERLQQHQRKHQMLSTMLQAVGQGPLRSKPDLTNYINRDVGCASSRPLCCQDSSSFHALPLAWDSKRKCLEEHCPAEGKATPHPRVLQGLQIACGAEAVLPESHSSHRPGSPFPFLPAESGLHSELIRETHIGDIVATCPEKRDSALDSTDTSDSCPTDSEETRTSQPRRAGRQPRGSSLQQPHLGSRPQGVRRWPRKADLEPPCSLQAGSHLPGFDDVEVGKEVKGGRCHMTQGSWFLREDAVPETPASEPECSSLMSQKQCLPELGNHQDHSGVSWPPCRAAHDTVSSMKLVPLGSGQLDHVTDNHEPLETICASSLQLSHVEPSAPHQVQQLALPFSPEDWIPTPPASRKSSCPVPQRKSARTGHHRWRHQAEPVDIPQPLSPRTVILSSPQTQPCSPYTRHPKLDLGTTSCINHSPLGIQESWAHHKGRVERDLCCQEPGPSLESSRDGAFPDTLGSADITTVNSTAITLSLASEESSQEPEGGLQRAESNSGQHMLSRTSPGASAAVPSDGSKKRSHSITSTLGLKKLFSALSHTSRPKLGTSRSYSVEQLQSVAPDSVSHTSTPKVKRAPSSQFLHQVSPSHQHRKAASFQNLHSLLSGKGDRSSLYLVEGSGDPSAPGRPAKALARRTLSVEDVGAPSLVRTVGRVLEVFPDGTSQLQLQRPPEGTFGFCVAYANGRRDSGLYVQAMADPDTAKLYSGLLGVGDEILEVNGAKVAGLGLAHIKELLAHVESLSIRVLRQRPASQ